jgi:signal transduction histidine kinase
MKKTSFLLVTLLITISSGLKANQVTDSLEFLLPSVNDSNKVKILCDLCWEYRFISADKAMRYGQEALSLAEEIKWDKGIAQSYNDMGILLIDQSDFKKAIYYFEQSLAIREKLNNKTGVASAHNKIGIVYQKQGKLKEALEHQIEALKIYEELDQERWIAYSLNNIAIIHQNLGNLENSLEYHEKAAGYQIKLSDVYGEAMSYGNIGNVYVKLMDTARAIQFYNKALVLFRQIKNKEAIAVQLSNLGDIYLAQGETKKALDLLTESLQFRKELGDQKGISSSLIKIGKCYINLRNPVMAKKFLYRGLFLAKEINVVEEEIEAYLNLAKIYAIQHQLDSAFVFTRRYIDLKDSVYDQRLKQQIVDVQIKYETEKIEQENALLQSENQLNEARIEQQKTERLLLIFIIISIAGASIFIYYRRKQKQKAALDAAIIRHNEQRLQAVIDGQEEERRRIARELHDGVGQKLAGIKINWESISDDLKKSKNKEQLDTMAGMLDSAASEVRTISHQMMPKELEQFGLLPAIESLLSNNLGITGKNFEFNHFGFNSRLPQQIELNLFRITQELVSNTIKHADATQLNVQLLKRGDVVVLIFEDNGKGFEVLENANFGIGLLNVESRVKSINATLDIESEQGKGTTIRIRTPLNE